MSLSLVVMEKVKIFFKTLLCSWNKHPLVASFFIFLAVFLFYSSIYINNAGISMIDDHFFHFKYANMLRTEGWSEMKDFKGGFLMKTENGESKFGLSLFHLAIIPFTYFQDKILGLKLSDIFLAASALGLFYYVLRKAKITYPLFFTFALLVSPFLIHRLLMGRSYVLTISLVFLEIYLASKKDYGKLFFVTLIHLFWHSSTFWLPIAIIGAVEAARYLVVQKFFYKNIFAGIGALIGGVIFLPNFQEFWSWLAIHFYAQKGAASNSLGGEGMELYTKSAFDGSFVSKDIFFAVVLICIALVIYFYVKQRDNANLYDEESEQSVYIIIIYASFIFLLVVILATMTISGRFYDYYYAAIIFLAAVILTKLEKDGSIIFKGNMRKYIAGALIVFIISIMFNNFIELKKNISSFRYDNFAKVARWLENNSKENELVFVHNWSFFPMLFFYNSKNIYTAGLEPSRLKHYSEELYWKWYNMYEYNFYCDKKIDCKEEAKIIRDKLASTNEEEKKEFLKESGRKMINSVKYDFGSRFIVSAKSNFSQAITLNSDLIEDRFETKSEDGSQKVEVFKLK